MPINHSLTLLQQWTSISIKINTIGMEKRKGRKEMRKKEKGQTHTFAVTVVECHVS